MATPSRSFLCLRHGVTDWNAQGLFQGRTDVPLNGEGIAQAHAAAERLRNIPFDHVVASPLSRALKTAEIIASARHTPLDVDDGIIECDFGSLEGTSIAETMKAHGLRTVEDLVSILPPDGEPWPSISARALSCVSRWFHRHPQAVILFVCHDAVMQAMSEALCGQWIDNRHGTLFRYDRAGDVWSVAEVDSLAPLSMSSLRTQGPITTGSCCSGRRQPSRFNRENNAIWVPAFAGTTVESSSGRCTPSPTAT
ncbi:histidine phosphatase family protein [Bradyrhizobium sp. AZCC 1693]|uniref:histidine phosphatase family protein n=1 Tax=Bradyrhizobium sp. AZCC 1693 TaxID=3117029 RepID=UPI002FEF6B9A